MRKMRQKLPGNAKLTCSKHTNRDKRSSGIATTTTRTRNAR